MDILNSNFEVFKAGGKQSREQVVSQLLCKLYRKVWFVDLTNLVKLSTAVNINPSNYLSVRTKVWFTDQ